jgi:hypothetical protein
MAKSILRDAKVYVNGVDLSDHVQKATVTKKADEQDTTAMGAKSKETLLGISDDQIQVTFFQDHAEGSVNRTLAPLQGSNTTFTVKVVHSSGSVSKTNPGWEIDTAILPEFTPLDGQVGSAETTDCTFKPAGGEGLKELTS